MSVKIYPVTKTELQYNGYGVKINGSWVETDTARVSAMPFNRRWPGHQRQVDQSELINFVSLAADEPLVFEIYPRETGAFTEQIEIRPRRGTGSRDIAGILRNFRHIQDDLHN